MSIMDEKSTTNTNIEETGDAKQPVKKKKNIKFKKSVIELL